MKIPNFEWIPFDKNNPPTEWDLGTDHRFLIILREYDYANGGTWEYSVDVAEPFGNYLDDFWTPSIDWLEGQPVEVVAYAHLPYIFAKEMESTAK